MKERQEWSGEMLHIVASHRATEYAFFFALRCYGVDDEYNKDGHAMSYHQPSPPR